MTNIRSTSDSDAPVFSPPAVDDSLRISTSDHGYEGSFIVHFPNSQPIWMQQLNTKTLTDLLSSELSKRSLPASRCKIYSGSPHVENQQQRTVLKLSSSLAELESNEITVECKVGPLASDNLQTPLDRRKSQSQSIAPTTPKLIPHKLVAQTCVYNRRPCAVCGQKLRLQNVHKCTECSQIVHKGECLEKFEKTSCCHPQNDNETSNKTTSFSDARSPSLPELRINNARLNGNNVFDFPDNLYKREQPGLRSDDVSQQQRLSPQRLSGFFSQHQSSRSQQQEAVVVRFDEKNQMIISRVPLDMVDASTTTCVQTPTGNIVAIDSQIILPGSGSSCSLRRCSNSSSSNTSSNAENNIVMSPDQRQLKINLDTFDIVHDDPLPPPSTSNNKDTDTEFRIEDNRELTQYLKIDEKDVKCLECIGSGTFSDVYKAELHATEVAVKKLKNLSGGLGTGHAQHTYHKLSKDEQTAFANELRALKRLRHKNTVLFVGYYLQPYPAIITEFCAGKTLFNILHTQNVELPKSKLMRVSNEVLLGMIHIHEKILLHGDLKSKNIFLTEHGDAKIGDMGLSLIKGILKSDNKAQATLRGTLYWMAPEVIKKPDQSLTASTTKAEAEGVLKKSDVYSFGIVLFELWSGQLPYANLEEFNEQVIMYRIGKGELKPDLNLLRSVTSDAIRKQILACLATHPNERPSFKELEQKKLFSASMLTDNVRGLKNLYEELAESQRQRPTHIRRQRKKIEWNG